MTKGKNPPKKKQAFMKTHSRRTGKIILLALGFLSAFLLLFFYFAIDESNKIKSNEDYFRSLSCEEMRKILSETPKTDPNYSWYALTINDKVNCN